MSDRFPLTEGSDCDVSVVIPFYNDSSTISRALRSVREQLRQPREIIIVDDASEEGEFLALRTIADSFSDLNIRLYRQSRNSGPSAARNYAWNRAKGAYIGFLDADDAWHPTKLLHQIRTLDSHSEVALVGTRGAYGEQSCSGASSESIPVTSVTALKQLVRNRFITSSVVLRAELGLRFDERLRYSEDNDLWCRIILCFGTAMVLESHLVSYFKPARSRAGASGKFGRMYMGQLRVYQGLRRARMISHRTQLLSVCSATVRLVRRMLLVFFEDLFRCTRRTFRLANKKNVVAMTHDGSSRSS